MRFDDSKVTYEIEAEFDDIPVRGNAMASGDDAFDKEVEDKILRDIEDGDVWAWAAVTVTATYDGIPGVAGSDHLGAVSEDNEERFKEPGGYYDDMKNIARDELYKLLRERYDNLVSTAKSGLAALDEIGGD